MGSIPIRYVLLILGAGVPSGTPAICDVARDARGAVEARYAALAEAIRQNNVEKIPSFQAPNFSSSNPNGKTFDYAAMESYTRRLSSAIDSVVHIQNVIRSFELHGDKAVAEVCQEFSRMQRIGDGQPHRVDTSALQRETWVRRDGQWRRQRVEDVHGMRWFVDGVRVDPSKPYTHGMPAYEPESDPPTGCGLR